MAAESTPKSLKNFLFGLLAVETKMTGDSLPRRL
jgi:hypothetical protein